MFGGQRKNLYSNYLRNAGTLSKIVLTNGVWIWAIRIVMWTCWRFLVHFVYQRTNWACFSINACTLTSEYGSVRYVSTLQKRWCWNIQIIATTSFQLSVDSLVELIFTESSRQKKAVLLQHGETSNQQKQHKMVQIEHNHFFVKYQRKSKIFIKKQPKRCRIRMNATHEQVKTTPSFGEIHYICDMKEIIETMPRIELALIIIGVFVLILGIILGYAMIHEYRM